MTENVRYPYRKIARLALFFTIIVMIVVFFFSHPKSYTTNEIHAYEALADAIITKGAVNLAISSNIGANEISQAESTQTLYYDKIVITQTSDNMLMLNIINDKKGDIQFKFDSKYSAPQATIVTRNYWIQCFMETFIMAPTLSFPIFFIIILFLYEIYLCKKNNTPIF